MPYEELSVLIPSHSLEDFPTELGDEEAASLLNAFAVIWHPLLIVAARTIPSWHRTEEPPEPLENRLVIVPLPSETWLPGGWIDRAKLEAAHVVHGISEREEMIAAAIEPLEVETEIDPDLVADFMALGSCYLQIELLTRHMHHYSNLDEVHLQREVISAAEAAVANDAVAARSHLRSCFEVFTEARERFYPVDCYLIDLCLLIPRLADKQLEKTVAEPTPCNVLVTAHDLEEIAAENPTAIESMRTAWHAGEIDIVGGEYREAPSPQVPLESLLYDLHRGHHVFQQSLGRAPTTWGRRRFGLSTLLPQILSKFGYHSGLHFLLDDGIYPDSEQSKIRWEGCDGTITDAITRIPLAADSAASFLRFAMRMAESMEEDHVAAIIFARWPELQGPWFEDFRRMQRFSPALGRFVTFNNFFGQTEDPGRLSSFSAGEYLSPFLIRAVAGKEADPISRFTRHTLRRCDFDAGDWYRSLATLLSGRQLQAEDARDDERILEDAGPDGESQKVGEAEAMLDRWVPHSAAALEQLLTRGAEKLPGMLLLNSLSFARTAGVELPQFQFPPPVQGPVKVVQFDEKRKIAVVELPPCGYVWIPAPSALPQEAPKSQPQMVHEHILRNEFFEVHINETTGGIARIKEYGRHPNRLSQQLAFRFPRERKIPAEEENSLGAEKTFYSEMRCSNIEVTSSGPVLGEIVTSGDLVDQTDGTKLAGFRQKTRLWRSRPIVEIEIEFEVVQMPAGDPWTNYIAARFAWNDSTASLTRSVQGMAQPFRGERFESADYLEIATEEQRTTILNLGLPFHRKTGPRMVDSLLVVEGESERRFHFVIALDQAYPLQAALDAATPVVTVATESGPPRSGNSGWFFQIDAPNVQLTRVLPLADLPAEDREPWESHDADPSPPGKGFALRLIETEGRYHKVHLNCFRTPDRARQRDFQGRTLTDLTIQDDSVVVDMTAYEIVDVEVRFDD